MSSVFYRAPGQAYPRAVRGEGVYLWDADGQKYLDGSGGAAISCLGHGHAGVISAVRRQAGDMAFAHTQFFTNEPQEQLAKRLAELCPIPDARVYFLSGGSEANETALKLVRQYWRSAGEHDRHIVITRRQSYHGNTLGALSVTGHTKRRAPYEPMLHQWPRVSPCNAYRDQLPNETTAQYVRRLADELDQAIVAAGPGNVAAFMGETVVGASLGAVPPAEGYWRAMREVCDRHGILLVLDEVMAGCGRTGTWHGFEQDGIQPDIVTLAKGISGGYQPLGAALASGAVHERMAQDGFAHGHTFVGHATACAAGLAVLDAIEHEDLLKQVRDRGRLLRSELRRRFGSHAHVGEVRGRGLFVGLELVRDRETRQPVPAEWGLPAKLRKAAMAHGLICYPGGGTADGKDGAHILLAPPFIISEPQVHELCELLSDTLGGFSFDGTD